MNKLTNPIMFKLKTENLNFLYLKSELLHDTW